MKPLERIHRCEIDQLDLTADQWEVLLTFLNHNLRNGLSAIQLLALRLATTGDRRQVTEITEEIERVIARFLAMLETLEEVKEGKTTVKART